LKYVILRRGEGTGAETRGVMARANERVTPWGARRVSIGIKIPKSIGIKFPTLVKWFSFR